MKTTLFCARARASVWLPFCVLGALSARPFLARAGLSLFLYVFAWAASLSPVCFVSALACVCARAFFPCSLSLSLLLLPPRSQRVLVCVCLFGVVVLCWSSSFALFCITISLLLFSFIAGGLVGMVWRARSEAPLMIIGTGMKQREDTTTTRAQGLLFFKACSQRARGLFARVRRRVVFFLPPRALTTKTKEQSRRQKRACAPTFFDTAREKSDRASAHDERADSLQRLRHIYLPHEKGTTTDRGGDGPAPSFAPKKKERTTMKRE